MALCSWHAKKHANLAVLGNIGSVPQNRGQNSPQNLTKLFGGVVRFRDVVTITEQKNRNGRSAYYALVGYDRSGKTVRRSLGANKDAARAFLSEINRRIAEGKLSEAANVFEVAADFDIKAALRRLQGYGAPLNEAVDFFIQHHRPLKGVLTLQEAAGKFYENLNRQGSRTSYVESMRKNYVGPFVKKMGERRLIDISLDDAEKYIFKHKNNLNAHSKAHHIQKLRVFFNALAKMDYYSKELNPFTKVEIPKPREGDETILEEKDRLLNPDFVKEMLDFAVAREDFQILVAMVLVLFCGVRVQEVSRLKWADIDLQEGVVKIGITAAKKRSRRANQIPENTLHWLKIACQHVKPGQQWVQTNLNPKGGRQSGQQLSAQAYRARFRRFRRDFKKHALKNRKTHQDSAYLQNGMRVSFASYALHKFGKQLACEMMGENNPVTYDKHYREVAKKTDAEKYFNLVPEGVMELRRLKAKQMDNEAYEDAKTASTSGMEPVQDEYGKWHPVTTDFFDLESSEGGPGN